MGSNMTTRLACWFGICSLVLLAAAGVRGSSPTATEPQAQRFDTPEQAVQAMASLIGKNDQEGVERVFGAGSVEVFASGDPEADAEDFQRVKAMIDTRVGFSDLDAQTKVALLGEDEWPWPIPLMHDGKGWRFDMANGREELLNRRIGRNELQTLAALHEIVDAQREYMSEARDGQRPAFAQKFLSSEGRKDGLYWPPVEGEDPSPLGDLLADADVQAATEPQPFHGYYYRILRAQGPAAPGGNASYVDDQGLMTRGFAVIAWPAKYGNSGVMTFMTSQHDIVFQKDLGADTDALAKATESFDPDLSWEPTADSAGDAETEDEDEAEAEAESTTSP